MTPEAPFPVDGTATTVVDSPRVGSRLRLKPGALAPGFLAGGWWPRSRDPVAEFSALAYALAVDFGVVDRIGFSLAYWDLAPRGLLVGGDTIRLTGLRGLNPHTVVVLGPGGSPRRALLVVPAEADRDAAGRALALAAARDNRDDAEEILAASGVLGRAD